MGKQLTVINLLIVADNDEKHPAVQRFIKDLKMALKTAPQVGYDFILGQATICTSIESVNATISKSEYDVIISYERLTQPTGEQERIGAGVLNKWRSMAPGAQFILFMRKENRGGDKPKILFQKGFYDCFFGDESLSFRNLFSIITHGRTPEEAAAYYNISLDEMNDGDFLTKKIQRTLDASIGESMEEVDPILPDNADVNDSIDLDNNNADSHEEYDMKEAVLLEKAEADDNESTYPGEPYFEERDNSESDYSDDGPDEETNGGYMDEEEEEYEEVNPEVEEARESAMEERSASMAASFQQIMRDTFERRPHGKVNESPVKETSFSSAPEEMKGELYDPEPEPEPVTSYQLPSANQQAVAAGDIVFATDSQHVIVRLRTPLAPEDLKMIQSRGGIAMVSYAVPQKEKN